MTLRTTFRDLFTDPISLEEMRQPVMNSICGHTYEKVQIDGWVSSETNGGRVPGCPQCRKPIGELTTNYLVLQALNVLQSPDNSLVGRVEDLTDEERTQVERAIQEIRGRRVRDEQEGIPDRSSEARSFNSQPSGCCQKSYYC